MKWTLINPAGTNDPDTGDIYSGLDRFGRVKDNRWLDGAGADLDRIQYGYDRAGNRIWRRNVVAAALGKEFDELYSYDAVHRLQDMARGTLNGSRTALTSETFAQCWTLDSTGNWQGFREDDTGNGTWDLVQSRTANQVNEITNISDITGPSWIIPAYNRAGNMTTMPKAADPTTSHFCTYDAWNRLVKVAEGANTVSEYGYDGTKRRIIQNTYTGGSLTETRHFYFTEPSSWQVLEERVDSSTDAERQLVWGLKYIDDLVLRDRDTERLYAMQGANWSVTGIMDTAGAVQERFAYAAYGTPMFLSAAFVPQSAGFDWETLYCGTRFNDDSQLYLIRNRSYHSLLGIWCQRDILGYIDGLSLTAAWFVPSGTDPTGNARCCHDLQKIPKPNAPKPTKNGCTSPAAQEWCFTYVDTSHRPFWKYTLRCIPVWKECNKHDICYQTCGNTQEYCDQIFHLDLQLACEKATWLTPDQMDTCLWYADDYYWAVSGYAGGAWRASQGNRILIPSIPCENGFEDVVVPAGLEPFAAD